MFMHLSSLPIGSDFLVSLEGHFYQWLLTRYYFLGYTIQVLLFGYELHQCLDDKLEIFL